MISPLRRNSIEKYIRGLPIALKILRFKLIKGIAMPASIKILKYESIGIHLSVRITDMKFGAMQYKPIITGKVINAIIRIIFCMYSICRVLSLLSDENTGYDTPVMVDVITL